MPTKSKPTLTDISLNVLKTRLKSEKKKNFNFVFFGDSWFDWGDASKSGTTMNTAKKDAILRYQIVLSSLQAATKVKPKPLFILYGGDAVRSGAVPQLTYFRDTVAKFVQKHKIPFFLVPGNHERNGAGGPLTDYQNIIGPKKHDKALKENSLNYILNTPDLRMIMLNDIGPVSGGTKFGITSQALSTFNKGIKTGKRVLVVMHVPPKSGSFSHFPTDEAFAVTTPNDKQFIATLKKTDRVKLVLVSHIHNIRLKGKIAGKVAVLNGNGGAGTDTTPTPHPVTTLFHFDQKKKTIAFKGDKTVKVNTFLKPTKVFIATTGGTIITIPIKS